MMDSGWESLLGLAIQSGPIALIKIESTIQMRPIRSWISIHSRLTDLSHFTQIVRHKQLH